MQKPFRFGVVSAGLTSPDTWVPLARRVEELGYASLLMPDRPSIGGFALFSALAVAAATTTSLHVGSYVFCNDYRHPAMLYQLATSDMIFLNRVAHQRKREGHGEDNTCSGTSSTGRCKSKNEKRSKPLV